MWRAWQGIKAGQGEGGGYVPMGESKIRLALMWQMSANKAEASKKKKKLATVTLAKVRGAEVQVLSATKKKKDDAWKSAR